METSLLDPGDSRITRRNERTGERTHSRTRLGWSEEGNPSPSLTPEAASHSPSHESTGTVKISADGRPLQCGGALGADAVDLLRGRVAALRAGEDRVSKTQWWLCRVMTEGCLDCTAA